MWDRLTRSVYPVLLAGELLNLLLQAAHAPGWCQGTVGAIASLAMATLVGHWVRQGWRTPRTATTPTEVVRPEQ